MLEWFQVADVVFKVVTQNEDDVVFFITEITLSS